VLSSSFFISGLGILHQALLERSLAFDSLAKLEIASVLAGAVVGVVLAVVKAGVWSLVFQSLTTVSLTTILLWLSNPWRPSRLFQWGEIKAVSHFSLNLTGFSIFNYFARNADYLLIGRYLGAQELGYYTLAYRILLFPLQNISAVIGRVMYPILSTLQDDNTRFGSVYLRVCGSIALISFPLMTGIFVLAEPFVLTFFGEKWIPVIPLIKILAPLGLLQSIGTTVGDIYQAKGKTDWMFRWGVGSGLFVMVSFMIGLRWGIIGVTMAYAIASTLLFYPSFVIPFRLIDLHFGQLLRVLRLPLLNSSLMFIALMLLKLILPLSVSYIFVLILSMIVGIATYFAINWMINRRQMIELWDLTGINKRKLHESG
jgi:PST family polysaccharide transporter